uniref:Uncharacterized protein n=1 Tax=Desertifilum tharense IPPAS B-1220 TaxID=1781255 RepID=A0ACD5GYV2_9CYAN
MGVGEEGSWELGVGGWGRKEFSNNSTLFSHSAHRYAEAKATALITKHSLSPHPLSHSALSTLHSALREALTEMRDFHFLLLLQVR